MANQRSRSIHAPNSARQALKGIIFALTILSTSLAAYCVFVYFGLPNIDGISPVEREKSSATLEYTDVPDNIVSAFVAAEDKNFFRHNGIDYVAGLRAIGLFVKAGKPVNGASTITMQLAKNLLLGPEKSLKRKLSQFFLARKLENKLTKNEIITLYLDAIYFGNDAYGLEPATQLYFGKSPNQLSLSEAAFLAGVVKAPSRYNPSASLTAALARRNWVLDRMLDDEYIGQAQFEHAKAEALFDTEDGDGC